MAQETIDKAVDVCNLKPSRSCQTSGLLLDGAHGWSPTMHVKLVQTFGIDVAVSCSVIDIESCCISYIVYSCLWFYVG